MHELVDLEIELNEEFLKRRENRNFHCFKRELFFTRRMLKLHRDNNIAILFFNKKLIDKKD